MSWLAISCIPPFLWAFNNLCDEYLGKHHFAKNGALLIYLSSFFELLPAIFFAVLFPQVWNVALLDVFFMGGLGMMLTSSFVPYIWAIQHSNSGNAVPVYQTIPVFVFFLGWIFLGETATALQFFAAALIIGGSTLVGFDFTTKRVNKKSLLLMLSASFVIAIYAVLSKVFIVEYGWQVFAAWSWFGASMLCLALLLAVPGWKSQSRDIVKSSPARLLVIFFLQIASQAAAVAVWFKAVSIGPSVALVQTIGGLQPVFVLIYSVLAGIFFTKYFPKVPLDGALAFKFAMVAIIMAGVYMLTL